MKLSTKQFRPTVSKVMMALTIATVVGATSMTSAFAKDKDDHHDNGRHRGQQRSERNDHRDWRAPYTRSAPSYYYSAPSYYHSEPVYAPPPVYYAPQPTPGISLFVPLDIRF